jgi:CBS domain-containing protein
MRARDLLRRKDSKVFTVRPDARVGKAVGLLLQHNIGGLPVVTPGGSLVGFLSERDIAQAVLEREDPIKDLPVEHIMHRPAPTCSVDDTLHGLMSRMTRRRLRHLVVTDGDRIVGVASIGDLVKHRLEQLETEAGVLRDYVAAQRARG